MESEISEFLRQRNVNPDQLRVSSDNGVTERRTAARVTGFGVLFCALAMFALSFDPLRFGAFFQQVAFAAGLIHLVIGGWLLDRAAASAGRPEDVAAAQ